MSASNLDLSDPSSHEIIYPKIVPFILMHIAALAAIWTGITVEAVVICLILYVVRVFGITGGFHRYFSHKSYKTSRVFQFILAWMGQMSMQRGVLWWAAKHREHHRDSDNYEDAHSPRHHGFLQAHVGWVFSPSKQADMDMIKDFSRYPELRWLNKHKYLPGIVTAVLCYLIAGLPGLVVGFVWSTVLVYHATFCINSLAHVLGKQRYLTGDDSRNHWFLAMIALGEGWHNNHHYYPAAAPNGFFWWEVDITYYILRILSWFGLVWDLRMPPEAILSGEKKTPNAVIDKVANHIASDVCVDSISDRIRARWHRQGGKMEEFMEKTRQTVEDAEAYLAELELPEIPTYEELKARASRVFAETPSLDEAVIRAQRKIRLAVSERLADESRVHVMA